MPEILTNCHDCDARPGQPHQSGCDVERCSVCGLQLIGCTSSVGHDKLFARWTGIWPGLAEVQALGIAFNEFHRQELYKFFFVKPK